MGCAAGFILGVQLLVGAGFGAERGDGRVRTTEWVELECGTLEDYRDEEQFDLIAMLQSMMHFVRPAARVQAAAGLTKPGGFWLVEAFNPRSITARLMGKHWHDYNRQRLALVFARGPPPAAGALRFGAGVRRPRTEINIRGTRQVYSAFQTGRQQQCGGRCCPSSQRYRTHWPYLSGR